MSFQCFRSFWESKVRPLTSELDKLPKYSKCNTTCHSDHQLYSVPQTTSCTQSHRPPAVLRPILLSLTIRSLHLFPLNPTCRGESHALLPQLATSNILSSPPVIESPLFDQVREQIYSQVASLVSENESRPYYLMELLRSAQLLNTDYLRQTGLNSLKRVINNYLNPNQIFLQTFLIFPALRGTFPPDTQLVQEEGVYSRTQNFPLVRHYMYTDKIFLQAFLIFPALRGTFPPDSQLVQEEGVYSRKLPSGI